MKGLLIKDICLMAKRKNYFILLIAVCIFISLTADFQFVMGYMTIILSLFATSSVSYDEFDNCYPQLMGLPITRKEYVKEKYLYGLLLSICGWLLSFLLIIVISIIKHLSLSGQDIVGSIIYIALAMIVIAVYLPIIFKYGSEKSRTVLLIIYGVIAVIVLLAKQLLADWMPNIIGQIGTMEVSMANFVYIFSGIIVVVSAAACWLSMKISTRIIENKEF